MWWMRPLVVVAALGWGVGCPAVAGRDGGGLPAGDGGRFEGEDGGAGGGGAARADGGAARADGGAGDEVDGGFAGEDDAGGAGEDGGLVDGGQPGDAGALDGGAEAALARCFAEIQSATGAGPRYELFAPVIGAHCAGTDHQEIEGVERVVFLGDSVTVGTPPTPSAGFYRSLLADRLAARFGLTPPSSTWKAANPLTGQAGLVESGDFASCAKWGARADDLHEDNHQIDDCFPPAQRSKRTLVVMTVGGNDVAAITKRGAQEDATQEEVTAMTEAYVAALEEAVGYLKDPIAFPGGVHLVLANVFEFTDGTGDVGSCPAAEVAGFGQAWQDPDALAALVLWATEQTMRIAVETSSDLVFLLEHFCGHGFHHDDPQNACFRGEGAERWFDSTCIHPNPIGHARIADLFMSVVEE